jgi:hypothetical protein
VVIVRPLADAAGASRRTAAAGASSDAEAAARAIAIARPRPGRRTIESISRARRRGGWGSEPVEEFELNAG